MSFFPAGFDPRAATARYLHLVNINTTDGDFGFILGADGAFRDTSGKRWVGSTLLQGGDDEMAIGGAAPSGSLSINYFQDPAEADVVAQLRALGVAYVEGREVTFYIQPLAGPGDLFAPTLAPIRYMTRIAKKLVFGFPDHLQRQITLTYESVFEMRQNRRALAYNTADHAILTGAANPSLRYAPTSNFQEQKLFG